MGKLSTYEKSMEARKQRKYFYSLFTVVWEDMISSVNIINLRFESEHFLLIIIEYQSDQYVSIILQSA